MATITGIVKLLTTPIPDIPVHVYLRSTGELIDSTVSASDGTFEFTGLDELEKYTVVALSDNPNYNDAIDDGVQPQELVLIEIFTTNLDNYTLISGSLAPFSTTSPTLFTTGTTAANNGSVVRRNITRCYITKIVLDFIITDINSDDAVIFILSDSGIATFNINPCREAAFDALRRPRVNMKGTAHFIHTTGLTEDVNYQLEVNMPASGDSIATITNLDTDTLVSTYNFGDIGTRPIAETMDFSVDWAAAGVLSTTNYSTIKLYYELI